MTLGIARNLQILMSVLLIAMIVGISVEGQTRDGKGKGDKGKNDRPDPPGTGKYLAQLRAIFDAWDTNNDRSADQDELAKACRGASAKAFDPEADFMKLDQYPDYHLFKLLDKNKDWAISKAEFDAWAKDHAANLAEQELALERIVQKAKQLNKADPKSKNYDKLKNELKREREQADRMQDRLRAVQKQIQRMKRDDDDKGKNANKKGK